MVKHVTLENITNRLRLSIPTVSRAAGGFDYIAQTTRELGVTCADAMDYRTNIHAKSLVTKTTSIDNIIIIVVLNVLKSILNTYYTEVLYKLSAMLSLRLVIA